MKKNIFFKLLFLSTFVLSLSIAFVGCKNYDDDIDALEKRVDALEDLIPKGAFVNDVLIENGKLVVKYTEGEDKFYELAGEGKSITIGSDGYWYEGGVKTNFKIAAGSPRVSDDGYLEFPEVGSDGKTVTWKKSDIYASGAYVVETDFAYELWVAEKGKTELKKIVLSKSADIAKIDIIGWVAGKGAADEAIGRFDGDNGIGNEEGVANYIFEDFPVPYAWIEKFEIEDDPNGLEDRVFANYTGNKWRAGEAGEIVPLQVLTALKAANMGWIVQVSPSSADISGLKGFTIQDAHTGVLPITIGTPQLITGLLKKTQETRAAETSALYFLPFDGQLHNSDGSDITYPKVTADVAPTSSKYEELYIEDNLYTVVTSDGTRSEYPMFTIAPLAVQSFEAEVDEVLNGDVATTLNTSRQVQLSVNTTLVGAYEVYAGTAYTIGFNETVDPVSLVMGAEAEFPAPDVLAPDGVPELDAVIDYQLAMSPLYDNNEYAKNQFNITFSADKKSFTVGKNPDVLSLTGFVLRVTKLGIDGKIYTEDINIYVQRSLNGETIWNKTYLVEDANTRANSNVYLSTDAKASLDPMFNKLAGVDINTNEGKTNLKERWQHVVYGAKGYSITSLTIGGKKVDGTEYVDVLNNDNKPTLNDWLTMFATSGGRFGFFPGAENADTPAADNAAWNGPDGIDLDDTPMRTQDDLYDAKRLIIQPPYVRADEETPFFDINKEYVMRFEFFDGDDNFMSYADIRFTPVLPSLDGLFKREPEYWTGNTLNAYYRTPALHWEETATWFYDGIGGTPNGTYDEDGAYTPEVNDMPWETTPRTGSTFYNVFAPQASNVNHTPATPYDGGYTKFGGSTGTDKQWLDASSHIAFRGVPATEPDEEVLQYWNHGQVGTPLGAEEFDTYNTGAVFEFYKQTPVTANDADWYAKPIPMTIVPGKYLAVYDYKDYADANGNDLEKATATELANLNFDLKVMSALEQGTIKAKGADRISYIGGGKLFLTAADFENANYSGEVKYSLFTNQGEYDYNYVYSVRFFMPTEEEGFPNAEWPNVDFGTDYVFINGNGNAIVGATDAVQINPPTAGDTNGMKVPYIGLQISNTTNGKTTYLGVEVTDRFGKVKKTVVPIDVRITQ